MVINISVTGAPLDQQPAEARKRRLCALLKQDYALEHMGRACSDRPGPLLYISQQSDLRCVVQSSL